MPHGNGCMHFKRSADAADMDMHQHDTNNTASSTHEPVHEPAHRPSTPPLTEPARK